MKLSSLQISTCRKMRIGLSRQQQLFQTQTMGSWKPARQAHNRSIIVSLYYIRLRFHVNFSDGDSVGVTMTAD